MLFVIGSFILLDLYKTTNYCCFFHRNGSPKEIYGGDGSDGMLLIWILIFGLVFARQRVMFLTEIFISFRAHRRLGGRQAHFWQRVKASTICCM